MPTDARRFDHANLRHLRHFRFDLRHLRQADHLRQIYASSRRIYATLRRVYASPRRGCASSLPFLAGFTPFQRRIHAGSTVILC